MTNAFTVRYECLNCGHTWPEGYQSGTIVIKTETTYQGMRMETVAVETQDSGDIISCENCEVPHIMIKDRNPA